MVCIAHPVLVLHFVHSASAWLVFPRFVGRKPRAYIVNMQASKVKYHTSENDVRIYMETSNGIQKGGKEYNKVSMGEGNPILLGGV